MTWAPPQGVGVAPVLPGSGNDPTTVPDLQAWFDASDLSTLELTLGGTRVNKWSTKGPTGIPFYEADTGANGVRIPGVRNVNGLNAVTFDGVDDYLLSDAAVLFPDPFAPFTVMAVFVADDPAIASVMIGDGTGANATNFMELGVNVAPLLNSVFYRASDGVTLSKVDAEPDIVNQGEPFLLTAVEEGTQRNASLDNFETVPTVATVAPVVDRSRLGQRATSLGGQFFQGVLCEFVTYTRKLTQIEYLTLVSYFRAKWSLAVVDAADVLAGEVV